MAEKFPDHEPLATENGRANQPIAGDPRRLGSHPQDTSDHNGPSHHSPSSAFAIDILAVLLFALLARVAHNTPEMPLSFLGWLDTAWPFLLGLLGMWAVMWLGGQRGRSGHEVSFGVPMWIVTVVVGLVIWGIRHAAIPHWSFIVVASVTCGLLLVGWRALGTLFSRRRRG